MLDKHLGKIPSKINFEKYTLKNGLTVVLVPVKNVFSVDLKLCVRVGSQYERKEISGISHLLEHMNFKGTEKKPDSISLIKELEQNGGIQNASTDNQFTEYSSHIGFEYAEIALEFLSDIFTNSIFPETEFEKEKGVVIEEIRMYEDEARAKAFDTFLRTLYGDQPAGWNIAGVEHTVKNMTRNELVKYYKEYYQAKNSFLFVSGNYNSKSIKKLIEKYFETKSKTNKISLPKVKIVTDRPRVSWFKKDTKETHFVLGCNSYKASDKNNYVLEIIDCLLSSGLNSRLYLNIREKLGGAYYIFSDYEAYQDRGIFAIYGGINTDKTNIILTEVVKEINRLKTEKVGKEELLKAKNKQISYMLLGLDNPYRLVGPVIASLRNNHKVVSLKERIDGLLHVTSNDIMRVSNEIFKANNFKLGVVSPDCDTGELQKIIQKI